MRFLVLLLEKKIKIKIDMVVKYLLKFENYSLINILKFQKQCYFYIVKDVYSLLLIKIVFEIN